MPRVRSVLAQWCAEPQASITTRSTLRLSNQRSNCARVRRARSRIFQRTSASAISNTFFARSTATVVAFISDSSCSGVSLTPHHMTYQLGTMMPHKEREEAIPSLQPTRLLRPRAAELERWAVDRRRVDDLEIATCRSGGFED